jgi:hypothetical protein
MLASGLETCQWADHHECWNEQLVGLCRPGQLCRRSAGRTPQPLLCAAQVYKALRGGEHPIAIREFRHQLSEQEREQLQRLVKQLCRCKDKCAPPCWKLLRAPLNCTPARLPYHPTSCHPEWACRFADVSPFHCVSASWCLQ